MDSSTTGLCSIIFYVHASLYSHNEIIVWFLAECHLTLYMDVVGILVRQIQPSTFWLQVETFVFHHSQLTLGNI